MNVSNANEEDNLYHRAALFISSHIRYLKVIVDLNDSKTKTNGKHKDCSLSWYYTKTMRQSEN